MCYFLYGSLYGDVSESEYDDVKNKYGLKISLGTKHDIKSAVRAAAEFVQDDFRITDWICDCDSPVGKHYATLQEFAKEQGLTTFVFDTPSVATNCHSFFEKRGYRRIKKDELPFPYDFPDRDSYLYMMQQQS